MPGKPNKLTNRGAAGLLHKPAQSKVGQDAAVVEDKILTQEAIEQSKNNIAASLKPLAVSLASLVPDPKNARLHGDRNLTAIKQSLVTYGQVKPLVVRKDTMTVVAGNGTLECARQLGWTKIAASVVEMTDVQAAGYGLADNRTAELASWDFEVVAELEQVMREAGQEPVGWTYAELTVLRSGNFVPPPDQFPEVDEDIKTEHVCPRCSYCFSGGETVAKGETDKAGRMEADLDGDDEV